AGFGIPLTTLEDRPALDLAVDGADEVDPQLGLIKGHGGALLREKIVAQAAARVVIVVDSGKLSPILGTTARVPVEVVPFAWKLAQLGIEKLGGEPLVRTAASGEPYRTDNGNYILDCHFGPITEPAALERAINDVPGVMQNGLFVSLADKVIVGRGTTAESLLAPTNMP
ncbi:MAG: ribose 5-phosphate isomerase A, partial [Chloroflexota bacterium]